VLPWSSGFMPSVKRAEILRHRSHSHVGMPSSGEKAVERNPLFTTLSTVFIISSSMPYLRGRNGDQRTRLLRNRTGWADIWMPTRRTRLLGLQLR